MTRRKTTVYLDEEVLRAAKVAAARTGKKEYEVVEEALRKHLGMAVLERVWERSDLTGDEALKLAYEELHRSRRSRQR